MQCAWGLGYRMVEFKEDNLNITCIDLNITCIINGNISNLRLQHYIEAISSWCGMFFFVKVTFRHHEANSCANTLAKKSLLVRHHWSIFHSCPDFFYLRKSRLWFEKSIKVILAGKNAKE